MSDSQEARVAVLERDVNDLREAIHELKSANVAIASSLKSIENQVTHSKGVVIGGMAILSFVVGVLAFAWDKFFTLLANGNHPPGS